MVTILERRFVRTEARTAILYSLSFSSADLASDDDKLLSLRTGLSAAQATISTLVRTGKIGLKSFLFKANAPGIESPACECGWRREDAKHVILFCPRWQVGRRKMLRDAGTNDFLTLASTNKGLRAMTKWFIARGILGQFSLARLQAFEIERRDGEEV